MNQGSPKRQRGTGPPALVLRALEMGRFATSEEAALLRAIVERPEDDGVRLVYADWLEEHGQPERADFIRVQIELARLPVDDPRRPDLEARLSEGHTRPPPRDRPAAPGLDPRPCYVSG